MRNLLLLMMLTGLMQAHDGRMCTERTIRGSYGYTVTAAMLASPMPGAAILQGVIVGVRTHDGQGNFTQVDSAKSPGAPGIVDQAASGTYKVNPYCTGTAFLSSPGAPAPAELRFVVVKGGKEIYWILVSPAGPMALGHGIRQ